MVMKKINKTTILFVYAVLKYLLCQKLIIIKVAQNYMQSISLWILFDEAFEN